LPLQNISLREEICFGQLAEVKRTLRTRDQSRETMSDDLEVNNLVDVDTLQYETLKLLNEIKEIKKKKSSHSPFKG
jgi:hypothetical protein